MKKPNDFQRGERQKEVADAYRENWDRIFSKKEEQKEGKQDNN